MIEYVITLIISFIGIIAGGILTLISPEELKAGEKYWKILEWVILAAVIASILYFSRFLWAIPLAVILIFLKILKKEYPALALVLFLSAFGNFLFLAGSLIFIYGLPAGTLEAKPAIKNRRISILLAIIKNNILYLIIGFILLPLLLAYA